MTEVAANNDMETMAAEKLAQERAERRIAKNRAKRERRALKLAKYHYTPIRKTWAPTVVDVVDQPGHGKIVAEPKRSRRYMLKLNLTEDYQKCLAFLTRHFRVTEKALIEQFLAETARTLLDEFKKKQQEAASGGDNISTPSTGGPDPLGSVDAGTPEVANEGGNQ